MHRTFALDHNPIFDPYCLDGDAEAVVWHYPVEVAAPELGLDRLVELLKVPWLHDQLVVYD